MGRPVEIGRPRPYWRSTKAEAPCRPLSRGMFRLSSLGYPPQCRARYRPVRNHKMRGIFSSVEILMSPAYYTARVSRASASRLVFGVSGVNLNNRQAMASAVNLDGCLIQSIFLQPFHSPSLGEIARLFVVLSAGYIHRPLVSSIFVKDCSSVRAIPQHGTGVFTIWHRRPHMILMLALSIIYS